MKSAGIERVMKSFGCSDGVPARIKELKTINLRSNGNQELNIGEDTITFDTTNELIKIKEYKTKLISGIFTNFTIEGNILKDPFILNNKNFSKKYRPKIGDMIVYINKKDNSIKTIGTIEKISLSEVTVSKELPDSSDYYIAYVNGSDSASGVQYSLDPRFFIKYIPLTNYSTDIYLSFFSVVGFSTLSSYY